MPARGLAPAVLIATLLSLEAARRTRLAYTECGKLAGESPAAAHSQELLKLRLYGGRASPCLSLAALGV